MVMKNYVFILSLSLALPLHGQEESSGINGAVAGAMAFVGLLGNALLKVVKEDPKMAAAVAGVAIATGRGAFAGIPKIGIKGLGIFGGGITQTDRDNLELNKWIIEKMLESYEKHSALASNLKLAKLEDPQNKFPELNRNIIMLNMLLDFVKNQKTDKSSDGLQKQSQSSWSFGALASLFYKASQLFSETSGNQWWNYGVIIENNRLVPTSDYAAEVTGKIGYSIKYLMDHILVDLVNYELTYVSKIASSALAAGTSAATNAAALLFTSQSGVVKTLYELGKNYSGLVTPYLTPSTIQQLVKDYLQKPAQEEKKPEEKK